jgi:hypothetical protein
MKNSFFNNLLYTFVSVCMMGFVFANPDFATDGDGQFDGLPSFNFDASVTGIIGDGTVGVVDQDYLVAHVDGEIRGVGLASEVPFGAYAGSIAYLTTYGDLDGGSVDAPGAAISFYFYNGATGDITPINETINFISDGSDGSVTAPFVFTLGSSYPTAPECAGDDDVAVGGAGCAWAVNLFGCDMTWGANGETVGDFCQDSCDTTFIIIWTCITRILTEVTNSLTISTPCHITTK